MNNFVANIAVCILAFITITIGVLLMTGKAKLVIMRQKDEPRTLPLPVDLSATVPPKRKRGRPRKSNVPLTRHLYLPPNITEDQMQSLNDFFQRYKNTVGDKLILHKSGEGAEEEIEIPFPIHWESTIKEELSIELGGWV